MNKIRACVDCKNRSPLSGRWSIEQYCDRFASLEKKVDPVFGVIVNMASVKPEFKDHEWEAVKARQCHWQRSAVGLCGYEGLFFEEKEQVVTPPPPPPVPEPRKQEGLMRWFRVQR